MTTLEDSFALQEWLRVATWRLAKDAVAQVRAEIGEHYQAALEAAAANGASPDEAERLTLAALGSPSAANCEYRRVLLTTADAKMLREGNWEARAVCSRPWLKAAAAALQLALLVFAAWQLLSGQPSAAFDFFLFAIALSPFVGVLFIPINTPRRGLLFRCYKWIAMAAPFLLFSSPLNIHWSWLFFASMWPVAWNEWRRATIRRKLPVKAWPRQLYL